MFETLQRVIQRNEESCEIVLMCLLAVTVGSNLSMSYPFAVAFMLATYVRIMSLSHQMEELHVLIDFLVERAENGGNDEDGKEEDEEEEEGDEKEEEEGEDKKEIRQEDQKDAAPTKEDEKAETKATELPEKLAEEVPINEPIAEQFIESEQVSGPVVSECDDVVSDASQSKLDIALD